MLCGDKSFKAMGVRRVNSTEVAFVLLTQQPWVQILALPRFFSTD